MNKKKKRKGFNRSSMRCPYCGSPVIYRSADGIYRDNSRGTMLYVCSHYPECDAYVRVHTGTNIPVGSMANQPFVAVISKSMLCRIGWNGLSIHKCGFILRNLFLRFTVCFSVAKAIFDFSGKLVPFDIAYLPSTIFPM